MARLLTTGFETRGPYTTSKTTNGEGQETLIAGTVTADTTNQWSGSACAKFGASSTFNYEGSMALARPYYIQTVIKRSGLENQEVLIVKNTAGAVAMEIFLKNTGELQLWTENSPAHTVLESGFTCAANTHYMFELMIEMSATAGKDKVQIKIRNTEGTVLYESSVIEGAFGTTAPATIRLGNFGSQTGTSVYASQLIVNDNTGEKENSWVGFQKVALIKPTFDQTRSAGWLIGAAATTNLYKGLDNYPPIGKALASKTTESQIYDEANNATDTYEIGTPKYTDTIAAGGAGMSPADAIKTRMYIARGGSNSTTSVSLSLSGGSNPFANAVTKATGTTAAATEPTGWTTLNTATIYGENGDYSANSFPNPILKKGTASAVAMEYDMAGLYVSYEPFVEPEWPTVLRPEIFKAYASGITSLSLTAPARAAGHSLVVGLWVESTTLTPSTPTGWRLLGSVVNTGNMKLWWFQRDCDNSATDNFKSEFTSTGALAEMFKVVGKPALGAAWQIGAGASGSSTTAKDSAIKPLVEKSLVMELEDNLNEGTVSSVTAGWSEFGSQAIVVYKKEVGVESVEPSITFTASKAWVALNVVVPPRTKVRENLVLFPNFEGTNKWVPRGAGSTVEKQSSVFHDGANALKVVLGGTEESAGAEVADNYFVPMVAPGSQITVSAWIKAPTGTTVSAILQEHDSTGAFLGNLFPTTIVGNEGWQRLSGTFTLGANCQRLQMIVYVAAKPTTTYYIDSFMVEYAASAGEYFDGGKSPTSYAAKWGGTSNESISVALPSGEETITFEFSPTGTSASIGEEVDVFTMTEAIGGTSASTFAEVEVFVMEESVSGESTSSGEAFSETVEGFVMTANGESSSSGSEEDSYSATEVIGGTSSSSGSEVEVFTFNEGIVNGSSSSTGSEIDTNGFYFEVEGTSESQGESSDSSSVEEAVNGTSLSSGSIEEEEFAAVMEAGGSSSSSGSISQEFIIGEPEAPDIAPIEEKGRRRVVEWRFILVNSNNLEEIGEVKEARNKSVQLALDKPGGVQFEVPLDYGLFKGIEEIKHGVIAYRNKVAMHSGMIWNLNEDIDGNKLQVQSTGWFETLNHRILRENVGYPPFNTGVVNAGQIVFMPASGTVGSANYHPGGMLTIANAQHDTWLREGTNKDKMQRIISYTKGQSIGAAINQLSEIEAGFDFWVDPLTRVMSITGWNEVPDKTGLVVFGYNWGNKNIEKLGRQFDPSNMANRVTALGKYGGGFAEDVEAQNEYQLFEEMPQLNEVTDPNVLLAYAGGEVLLRGRPRQIYSFTPFPYSGTHRVPQPFIDYGIGDKVVFTAVKPPRVDIRGQIVRIYGMTINISDEGNEKISQLQISPS